MRTKDAGLRMWGGALRTSRRRVLNRRDGCFARAEADEAVLNS